MRKDDEQSVKDEIRGMGTRTEGDDKHRGERGELSTRYMQSSCSPAYKVQNRGLR